MSTHAKRSYTHQNNQEWTKNVRVLIMLKMDTMGRKKKDAYLAGRPKPCTISQAVSTISSWSLVTPSSDLQAENMVTCKMWESLVRGSVVRLHVNCDTHQLMSWQILLLHEWAIHHTGAHKRAHTHTHTNSSTHVSCTHTHNIANTHWSKHTHTPSMSALLCLIEEHHTALADPDLL